MLSFFGASAAVSVHRSLEDITVDNDKPLDYSLATDPNEWGGSCQTPNTLQSPINILNEDTDKKETDKPLMIEFKTIPSTKLVLTSNGVELEFEGEIVSLTANGMIYDASQFHFHSPSEHVFDNFYCSAEMHIVLNGRDDPSKHAVIAACLETAIPAFVNPFFSMLYDKLPANLPEIVPGWESAPFLDLSIESMKGAFAQDYYSYMGSYTTPPCTLDISWFVMQTNIGIPVRLMEFMQQRFKQPANHRPLQPLLGRTITNHRVDASGSDSSSDSASN